MRPVIIVQARMTSTRLPGKVMKTVLGKPLLEYQVERLRRASTADLAVATTEIEADGPIAELCERLAVPCFRGPEEDVLARYHGAAASLQADPVVRVTADCPVIDPAVVDRVVRYYLDLEGEYDYVSNCLSRTFPRGMDTEVFSREALDGAFRDAVDPTDREHVTPFLYRHPERFRLGNVRHTRDLSRHRWTVDTWEDFLLIREILEDLYPRDPAFGMEDILALFDGRPSLFRINAHVGQKIT